VPGDKHRFRRKLRPFILQIQRNLLPGSPFNQDITGAHRQAAGKSLNRKAAGPA
jgi:hypothetical protein